VASVDFRRFSALDPLVDAKVASSLAPLAINSGFPAGAVSNAIGDVTVVHGPAHLTVSAVLVALLPVTRASEVVPDN
jgi:hypothetical protein